MKKPIYGVGINDADYVVRKYKTSNGKQTKIADCPFYAAWKGMLKRVYCVIFKARHPSYADCSVCDEWKLFSNFKKWMEKQDWQGKELDKDIISVGNKHYCPEMCAMVCKKTNYFTLDCGAARGRFLIGSSFDSRRSIFYAKCRNPFTGDRESLGSFSSEVEAHLAWKRKKHEHALKLAEVQSDKRVSEALMVRYI